MSLFGSLMGDFDDDIFGNPMNAMNMQMRSMNRLMNSMMAPNPFNMLAPINLGFEDNALMERHNQPNQMGLFGFPAMPNINRLLNADLNGGGAGASYCSSSVVTMSSGPDGRPQVYQATTSTKTGPGGVRETRKTIQDSTKGIKKMAIGHHIGERSHIIEKEQDLNSGQLEERQEFINLEEEEAEDFDREFTSRAQRGMVTGGAVHRPRQAITIESVDDDDDYEEQRNRHRRQMPALPAPPSHNSSSSATTTKPAASRANATESATNGVNNYNTLNNNKNNYLGTPSRRAYRSHHLTGATTRRPLRTPLSSPLATTAATHSLTTTTSPSIHPHPYNTAAARRNYRAKHTKQHQKSHEHQHE
ncbi:myeloid leukemia factor-like isoform X2 [Teleopsis dalmanni]|uniref:myeloid leukemia factor-like isoform X2 n=1 Tax=Teleopsis dalmanni TaxID=139649 RepID=UPI0018CC901D|nr:myeloid leukemia factor-like isoform X2 [Teleopsis dalmanni]